MKIKIYLIIGVLIIGTSIISAQQSDFLDANHIKARIWCDGDLFWDKAGNPEFEYPQGSGKHANNLSGLWIIGKESGSYRGAVTNLRPNPLSVHDFYNGPLDTNCIQVVDSNTMALYNRVWKVSRAEIELFQLCHCLDPSNPACGGYVVPVSIQNWPGNPILEADGDHLLMENLLAPFFDNSGDGVYDYTDCDYPLIKGEQAIFWVMNDQGPHPISNMAPLCLEIRAMAYSTNCDNFLSDVIFVDYEIISRCSTEVDELYIGMYSEADAGNGGDDYVGTHVEDGYMYNYNSNLQDAQYGPAPIVTATFLLQGPYMKANNLDDTLGLQVITALTDTSTASGAYGVNGRFFGDGIIDNEFLGLTRTMAMMTDTGVAGIPFTSDHYYNYLSGSWKDFSRMVYGSDGYPSGSCAGCPVANYIFPFTSDPNNVGTKGLATSFSWAETNTGGFPNPNIGGQRKLVASSGPLVLKKHDRLKLTYAFMTSMQNNLLDSLGLDVMALKADSLIATHDSLFTYFYPNLNNGIPYENLLCPGAFTVFGLETNEMNESLMVVYPNPTKGFVTVDLKNMNISSYVVTDLTGRIVHAGTSVQAAENFTLDLTNFDNGIYFLTISTSGKTMSCKIVKSY